MHLKKNERWYVNKFELYDIQSNDDQVNNIL